MLVMKDIIKIYKNGLLELKALDRVSLTVSEGEFVAITGTSGSGKSTLMHIVGCLDRPNSGEYFLDGEDIFGHPDERLAALRNLKIGFVFQKFNLLPKLDALTNVEIPLIYRGEERNISRQRAAQLMERVGLGDRLHHRPNELSGGQQQRVAIARALVGDPPLILADEPTGNLDSRSGAEIMELFKQLNNQGSTLMLITHDPDVARQADRVIYLQDGRVIPSSGDIAAKREVS